jgi:hypothetical protein
MVYIDQKGSIMIVQKKVQNDKMWVVTNYFNPLNYKTRRRNFDIFYNKLKSQGAKVILVELIHEGQDSHITLREGDKHIKIYCNEYHTIWQKYTLINIGIKNLPDDCEYVTVMDCDAVMLNNDWQEHVIIALQKHIIIQPFDVVYYTNEDLTVNLDLFMDGFFYNIHKTGKIDTFKQVGLCWAMRREFFDNIDIFNKLVLGGTDTTFSHSCVRNMALPKNKKHKAFARNYDKKIRDYAYEWAEKVYEIVQGNVGYIRSSAIHLWHGDLKNKRYGQRGAIVRDSGFDIDKDVFLNNDGIWEWVDITVPAYKAIYGYLVSRKDDGDKK